VTTTPDFIEDLVKDLKPTGPWQVERRLAIGIGAGLAVSVAAMAIGLGVRPDIEVAVATPFFWVKFGYTILLALAMAAAAERLSRPGGRAAGAAGAGILIVITVAVLAAIELATAQADAWRPLIMGSSAVKCPWYILALAAPILAGTLWAMRGLGPTRLPPAGLAAGLVSGAAGAWIYSFHCDEYAIPFLAIWYTLGIAIVGAAGAGLARVALRW
jgi:hypothetical protein